jgi:hypothetical protein
MDTAHRQEYYSFHDGDYDDNKCNMVLSFIELLLVRRLFISVCLLNDLTSAAVFPVLTALNSTICLPQATLLQRSRA